MANPNGRWNLIPVWGIYLKGDDVTPITGKVKLTLTQRVTRVDGRSIYPEGASVERLIGDTSSDVATREAVRAAWRATDEAAAGTGFDGAAWDERWNQMMAAAVFASFPAADDPDIIQTGYQVRVEEQLNGGSGKIYFIQPLLAQLDGVPPGINLGLVEVPPGAPSAPAPVYAKGLAGGVASLGADGLVPVEQLPEGLGGGDPAGWTEALDDVVARMDLLEESGGATPEKIGSAVASYIADHPITGAVIHDQVNPSASWTIPHQLGRLPAVDLYVGGQLVEADVEATGSTVHITFPTPTAGTAVLV